MIIVLLLMENNMLYEAFVYIYFLVYVCDINIYYERTIIYSCVCINFLNIFCMMRILYFFLNFSKTENRKNKILIFFTLHFLLIEVFYGIANSFSWCIFINNLSFLCCCGWLFPSFTSFAFSFPSWSRRLFTFSHSSGRITCCCCCCCCWWC